MMKKKTFLYPIATAVVISSMCFLSSKKWVEHDESSFSLENIEALSQSEESSGSRPSYCHFKEIATSETETKYYVHWYDGRDMCETVKYVSIDCRGMAKGTLCCSANNLGTTIDRSFVSCRCFKF